MGNVTFDSTNFSEQLGIYDFFNVLLSGTIFIFGFCIISQDLNKYIWSNLSLSKSLGIILLIYILGMVLQEVGSIADRYIFKIYKGMNQKILKGNIDSQYEEEIRNKIITNPIVLARYRMTADRLIKAFVSDKNDERFENNHVNGFVFSVCQYYVSVCGKDKKVEKLRALFAMSKTLMTCFFLLSVLALFSVLTNTEPSINFVDLLGLSYLKCVNCASKVLLSICFASIGVLFVFRARRTMKNFLLILLGTYDALIRSAEEESRKEERGTTKVKIKRKIPMKKRNCDK